MSWNTLWIMRLEVLLTVLIIIHLIADISGKKDNNGSIHFAVWSMVVLIVIGFIPSEPATLFGSMYINDPLRTLLKNILSISTLIVFLQSTTPLKNSVHHAKTSPFYLSILSTLMGMFFMISAGDFLMLYLGLELATLPLTLLAAFNKSLKRSAEAGIKLLMSSAVSSAVLLFGLSMIYGVYGTLHFG